MEAPWGVLLQAAGSYRVNTGFGVNRPMKCSMATHSRQESWWLKLHLTVCVRKFLAHVTLSKCLRSPAACVNRREWLIPPGGERGGQKRNYSIGVGMRISLGREREGQEPGCEDASCVWRGDTLSRVIFRHEHVGGGDEAAVRAQVGPTGAGVLPRPHLNCEVA